MKSINLLVLPVINSLFMFESIHSDVIVIQRNKYIIYNSLIDEILLGK